jgi:hypothetical protein
MIVRVPRFFVLSVLSLALPLAAQLHKPQITSIYPPGGPLAGGTNVTIRGTNFQIGAQVWIGVPLTNVTVVSSSTITGTTGARSGAFVDRVGVTNPNGASSVLIRAFTYSDVTCCTYPQFTVTFQTGGPSSASSVCLGDLDGGPGRDMVAVTNGRFDRYSSTLTPSLAHAQTYTVNGNLSATKNLDINGDNKDDIAIATLGGNITTYLGDNTTPFTSTRTITSTAHAVALDSGDFNSDGIPDLVIPDLQSGNVSVCLGNLGGGGCAATSVYSAGTSAAGVVIGHFDGDDHLDFAASDAPSGTVTLFLGTGTGAFVAGDPIPAGTPTTEVMGLAAGYLNGDAVLDLAVSTGAILFGNNDGTFDAGPPLPETDGRDVVIADFNRDRSLDIAIDNSLSSVRIMLGNGQGSFTPGPTINTAGGLYDVFGILDIEGDGMIDLAIAGVPAMAQNTVTACPTITLSPTSLSDGVVDQSYSAAVTQSGGVGTATYSLSGNLPEGLSFFGGTISGTPTEVGTFTFTITAVDANGCKGQRQYTLEMVGDDVCPTGLVATANGITSVQLSWIGAGAATSYQVVRDGMVIATVTGTSYSDNVVEVGTTYRYVIRARNGQQTLCDSLPDLATTIAFTDDPLVPGTVIKAAHLTELRTAVNLVRAAAGLAPTTWSDPNPVGVLVKATHLTQLRIALNPARTALGVPAVSLPAGFGPGTRIFASDFTVLRNGVK